MIRFWTGYTSCFLAVFTTWNWTLTRCWDVSASGDGGDLFVAPRWQGIAGSCTNQLPGQQAPQGLLSFRTCLLAPWPSKQGENSFLCACLHVYMCVCVHTIDTYIYIFMHIYSGLSVSNCLANLASLFLKSSVQSRRQTEERFELLKRIMEQQK